jgi:pimeloyl-ACP methyl ester carboxylesterase
MELGYQLVGSGNQKVIVLHDWFCDHSSYDATLPYLNQRDFQFAFVDLRGYGASKSMTGEYTLEEASQDVLETADSLGWNQFHLVTYSMTALVGQNLSVLAPAKIKSLIAICPVAANGMPGAGEEIVAFMESAATNDRDKALEVAHIMTSHRHDQKWAEYKVQRWWECSIPQARVNYMHMFVETNIVDKVKGASLPIQVICTSDDNEAHRKDVMEATFGKWFPNAKIVEINNAGHYPMQETPVSLASSINRFLDRNGS